MDIISHGLWGGIALGRKNRRTYWTAFGFGIMPDLFSFGIFSFLTFIGVSSAPDWSNGPTAEIAHRIPAYVGELYHFTHSLVLFAVVFGIVWLLRRRPFLPLCAWGLHILVDIPTHSIQFYPTPFLWPISNYTFDGYGWGHPIILIPNIVLLILSYVFWRIYKKKKHK